MTSSVERLTRELRSLLRAHGPDHPQVQHLRWLLASHARRPAPFAEDAPAPAPQPPSAARPDPPDLRPVRR